MYKYEETTHTHSATLGYKLVHGIALHASLAPEHFQTSLNGHNRLARFITSSYGKQAVGPTFQKMGVILSVLQT